ncbi:MAG: hypothetical protein D6743_04165 [Calditrichaeota bacterium]|nr:MAG: hypothetical protein D6743_04165 [Calditrichota bacterium]
MTRFPLLGMHKNVACEKCHTSGKFKKPLRFANCSDCHRDVHRGQFVDRADRGRCDSCHDVFGFTPAKFGIEEHASTAYPLTGAHLAVPCVSCHLVATRGRLAGIRMFEFQNTRCNGCHADVHRGQFKAQIDRGGCESCHQTSDWLDNKFDHNRSRFPLVGEHRKVACEKCHKRVDVGTPRERILFKPMDRRCRGCHEDVHLGQFSRSPNPKACETCHTPKDWLALIFDHNRDALFKLRGAHEKVACGECHKEERKGSVRFIRFRPLDRRCEGCHGNK